MTQFLKWSLDWPVSFWSIALLFSVYQGIRGVLIQRHNVRNENTLKQKQSLTPWTLAETVYVHRTHDFVFNFVCTLAGFVAWHIEVLFFNRIENWAAINAGTGIFLVFLAVVALSGIAGVLPPILLLGKLHKGQ